MGGGSPFFKAHKIEMDFEHRHPKALEYVEETNEADVPELVHVLDQFARNIGIEYAYDYGNQRMTWLCNLFTNWMGDDGFLRKAKSQIRRHNPDGDAIFINATVVRKFVEDGKHLVEIQQKAETHRGELSASGVAIVELPSRS